MKVFLKLERLSEFQVLWRRWLFILPNSDFIYPEVRAADNPGIEIVRHHTCLGESFKLPGSGWIEDLRHLEREESVV